MNIAITKPILYSLFPFFAYYLTKRLNSNKLKIIIVVMLISALVILFPVSSFNPFLPDLDDWEYDNEVFDLAGKSILLFSVILILISLTKRYNSKIVLISLTIIIIAISVTTGLLTIVAMGFRGSEKTLKKWDMENTIIEYQSRLDWAGPPYEVYRITEYKFNKLLVRSEIDKINEKDSCYIHFSNTKFNKCEEKFISLK